MVSPAILQLLRTSGIGEWKLRVRNGDELTARVLRSLGNDRYLLGLKEGRVVVRSDTGLRRGMLLRLQATWKGSTLILKQITTGPAQRFSSPGARLSGDGLSRTIIDALVRSGMPVEPGMVGSIRARMETRGREDSFFARLLAVLADKGVRPSDAYLRDLLGIADEERSNPHESSGRDGPDGSLKRDTQEEQNEGRKRETGSRRRGNRAQSIDIGGTDEPREQFASQLVRQSSPGDIGKGALGLFNHLKGSHDDWMIVPYKVTRKDWSASGAMRLHRDGSERFDRCILTINTGKQSGPAKRIVSIGLSGTGKGVVSFIQGDFSDTHLVEKLRNLGFEVDDNHNTGGFDGFTEGDVSGPSGIDTLV